MSIPYAPSGTAASVGRVAYSGYTYQDPGSQQYAAQNADRIDAKYFLEPVQSNLLALWQAGGGVAAAQYSNKTFTCLAGLNVGDPVYVSAADTVTLSTALNSTTAATVGFVSEKPTSTTCYLSHFQRKTGLSGLTAGQRVYLTDTGSFGSTPGTVNKSLGRAETTTVAQLFAVNGDGYSGASGYSGYSGASGRSGYSAYSGYSGSSGTSGYSGESGTSGFSGAFSGTSGYSGESGTSGFSGAFSGISGYSGKSGTSGYSAYSGASGTSGYSAYSGASGTSGYSGPAGAGGGAGTSGTSGYSGTSGVSGVEGSSGFSGLGDSGYSGRSGVSGYSAYSGVSGYSGTSGYSAYSGTSGASGSIGSQGLSGTSGASGTGGAAGDSGVSGFSAYSGDSGTSGVSGYTGTSGVSGYSAISGFSGASGMQGDSGASGFSGTYSGQSGTSGAIGPSGSSGASGYSGEWGGVDTITYVLDGGQYPISNGIKGTLFFNYAFEILDWMVLADQNGDIELDVWRTTYAGFPSSSLASIVGTNNPIITSAQKAQAVSMAGWTTSIAANSALTFYVVECSAITRATLVLKIQRV